MSVKAKHPRQVYFIDACSLTELRRTYPQEHFPQVWKLLDRLAKAGRLLSVDEVLQELRAQDDEITEWADTHEDIFLSLEESIQLKARQILKAFPTLIDLKKKKSGADPFLIAAAAIRPGTVVTQERKSGGPPAVKIPDVCAALGIPCVTLLGLIQAEGVGK
jgi:hypothetical protein